mmetsp:Transcript_1410/g.4203  ORF Transcript_1410/g.4203 Transcript_1410/m.4203 type:complete len:258 (-) Transcript_1410:2164-2937(-)
MAALHVIAASSRRRGPPLLLLALCRHHHAHGGTWLAEAHLPPPLLCCALVPSSTADSAAASAGCPQQAWQRWCYDCCGQGRFVSAAKCSRQALLFQRMHQAMRRRLQSGYRARRAMRRQGPSAATSAEAPASVQTAHPARDRPRCPPHRQLSPQWCLRVRPLTPCQCACLTPMIGAPSLTPRQRRHMSRHCQWRQQRQQQQRQGGYRQAASSAGRARGHGWRRLTGAPTRAAPPPPQPAAERQRRLLGPQLVTTPRL